MLKQDFLSHFLAKFLAFCLPKKKFLAKLTTFIQLSEFLKKLSSTRFNSFR